MRITITGANGFFGSHLAERLLDTGDEVVAAVRPGADLKWLAGLGSALERREATLDNQASLIAACDGSDAVVHLAGATRARPLSHFFDINVGGTQAVLDACAACCQAPTRVVLCSSLAAAGPNTPGHPLTESQPARPTGAYGQSKFDAEKLVFADGRVEAVAMRPAPIYGPRDVDVLQMLQGAAWGVHLRTGTGPGLGFGGPPPLYNFIYATDAAEAFRLACHVPEAAGELFNLGDSVNYSPDEVEQLMAAAVGTPRRLILRLPAPAVRAAAALAEWASFRQARPPTLNRDKAKLITAGSWALDLTKAREVLGFEPALSFAEGLQRSVSWYRQQGWL